METPKVKIHVTLKNALPTPLCFTIADLKKDIMNNGAIIEYTYTLIIEYPEDLVSEGLDIQTVTLIPPGDMLKLHDALSTIPMKQFGGDA